ncbi:hypothetical protein [Primorskyibacter sp. 2E107]|uniref:hypothetical protein n=1 Tax=Primorskyibacter sp. 2E107 TaxID=3403458 RepID=UPI003AF5224D
MTAEMFELRKHGFRKLPISGPGHLEWFERNINGFDGDGYDPLRLNVYLTRDGGFTTIWFGLLDSAAAEHKLGVVADLSVNLSELYEEILFRGDIESPAFGATLLEAIRVDQKRACVLKMSGKFGLECHAIK